MNGGAGGRGTRGRVSEDRGVVDTSGVSRRNNFSIAMFPVLEDGGGSDSDGLGSKGEACPRDAQDDWSGGVSPGFITSQMTTFVLPGLA